MSRNALQSGLPIEVKRSLLFFWERIHTNMNTWTLCVLCVFIITEPVNSSFSLCVTEMSLMKKPDPPIAL